MTDGKINKTKQVLPFFVAAYLVYTVIYHIVMFQTLMRDDVTQDECVEQAHAGGIIPPQCLEMEVFKDWHKKGTEELLVEAPAPEDDAKATPIDNTGVDNVALVVDRSGENFAHTISKDLAGLEQNLHHLVEVSSSGENQKMEIPAATDAHRTVEALQGLMTRELGEHQGQVATDGLSSDGTHGPMDFDTFHARQQARHEERAERRAGLIREVVQRMNKLDTHLVDVVSDQKAWESTFLHNHESEKRIGETPDEPASPSKDSFMSKRLQWHAPTVHHRGSEFLEASLNKEPVIVSKKDVKHLPLTGKLPKVVAVTWVRGVRKTKARMMYFLDNFKLQDYKGPRQLVLVYHHKDTEAANIVNHYVDGVNIKGIAAHDPSQDSFPSDASVRYAAWSSDADIIAQWDFDEWHDPSRLSLQVRALAHTSMHACVLSTSSTSHSQEDEGKEISMVSLVGERRWMRQHWHPFSRTKLDVFGSQAHELVELDMQNKALMNNVSRIEHVFTEAVTVKTTPPVDQEAEHIAKIQTRENGGTDFSRGISECLSYDTSKGYASEDAAVKAIGERLGTDVSKKFHDLVKRRHDIIMKLQLLCFQSTMEKDVGKRRFMHDHVLEMDHIRSELDSHIKRMASLFGAPELI